MTSDMTPQAMASFIFQRFLDAGYEAVESYKHEYAAIALNASIAHINLLIEFIEIDDPQISKYWSDVKKEIKLLHNTLKT